MEPGTQNFSKEKCRCGNDKTSPHIQHKSEYSTFGMILYWIGISAIPSRINFFCEKCGQVIESTDDATVCKEFVGR